jgi:glutamate racemase
MKTKGGVVLKKFLFNLIFYLFIGLSFLNCNSREGIADPPFLERALNDPSDYYYVDFKALENPSPELPIGMFDSGTGGLTVLHALIGFDSHDNISQEFVAGGDGIKDFLKEKFIYFGDQANMPYGNYSEVDKTGFLKELILRDALFLLGNKYYRTSGDETFQDNKQTVKLIVIACNTATAYGKDDIEDMLAAAGSKIKVIGVIDAGVRGALASFEKDEDGTIAVMATAGTVSSNGYLNTFNALKTALGYSGNIEFIQLSGAGIAEAIDEEPDFIDRKAIEPRKNYKGPTEDHPNLSIKKELLQIYNFDTTDNALLCEMQDDYCYGMQLNSPENYLRFYLVALCEQLKAKQVVKPLKTLILGCTHYPYYSSFIDETLKELYNLKIKGQYMYRDVLSENIILIDPAVNTAKEVYEYLATNDLLNKEGDIDKSEFYISVPDNPGTGIITDSLNRFTYEYKYGRETNHFYDTKQVPVSRLNTSGEIISRFQQQIPEIYEMIRKFNLKNDKTTFLKPEERF